MSERKGAANLFVRPDGALMNFKFEEVSSGINRPFHSNRKQQQQYSNRRPSSASNTLFYLQSSSQHAFVLRRDFVLTLQQQNYTFKKVPYAPWLYPDSILSWDAIEVVKVFVDAQQHQQQQIMSCPICLEESYIAPRCLPCGHLFCLSCILHYSSYCNLDSTTTTTSNTATIKCPCCFKLVSIPQDLRSVQFVTVSSPSIHSRMKFRKIYRIKPQQEQQDSCITIAVPPVDFSNLNTLPPSISDVHSIFYRFNQQDTIAYTEQLSYEASTIQNAIISASNEPKNNETSRVQFLKMAHQMVQLELRSTSKHQDHSSVATSSILNTDHFQIIEVEADAEHQQASDIVINRSDSFGNQNDAQGYSHTVQPFYQAADGQLCFLSGFNMVCLNYEYSLPKETSSQQQNDVSDLLPLVVEGQVQSIQNIQITHDTRRRYSFLQQLPLYMEVKIVELHLPELSKETKNHFRDEFSKRRNLIKMKKRQEQQQHRKEEILKKKAQMKQQYQSINFVTEEECVSLPLSEEFGPPLQVSANTNNSDSTQQDKSSTIPSYSSFKSVVATGGVWPELSQSLMQPCTKSTASSLPRYPDFRQHKKDFIENTFQQEQTPSSGCSPATSIEKTKKKGKKVLLFSTSGHRGIS